MIIVYFFTTTRVGSPFWLSWLCHQSHHSFCSGDLVDSLQIAWLFLSPRTKALLELWCCHFCVKQRRLFLIIICCLGFYVLRLSSTIWPRLDLNSQFLCVSVLAFWVAMVRHTRPRWAFLIPLPCAFGFNFVTFFSPHSGTLTNRTPQPFVKCLLGIHTVGLALLFLWRQGSPLEYTSLGLLENGNPVFCSGCDWRCEWGRLSTTAVPTWSRPKELSTIDWYHKPLHVHAC